MSTPENLSEKTSWARKTRLARGERTQAAFSLLIGVPISSVRKWEQGVQEPSEGSKTLLMLLEQFPDKVEGLLELLNKKEV